MSDSTTQNQVTSSVKRLREWISHPRAFNVLPDDQKAIEQAVERVASQLLGKTDPILTIALAGCSGAGKSTLINALAGSTIAEAAEIRPCTMQPKIYHHRDFPSGGLPAELASQAKFVAHDRQELFYKVIVDTPDLDTFATQNRAATKALLKAAGLVIYVFSPERYLEERAWSVIREEQRFSDCLVVLNKSDTVPPDVIERIADDLRARFTEMGKPDIQLLRIIASHHTLNSKNANSSNAIDVVDEFGALRAYIEHELQAGDIARMIRVQRTRVVEHLRELLDRAVGADLDGRIVKLDSAADERAKILGQTLADQLSSRLAAAESELAPLAILRSHQRFWGPFRLWLSMADFLTYGLPRIVRSLRIKFPEGNVIDDILSTGQVDKVDDAIKNEARKLQDFCYANQLPVDRWREISSKTRGDQLLNVIAQKIASRSELIAASTFGKNRIIVNSLSFLGAAAPAVWVVFGIYTLILNMAHGKINGGIELLGVIVAFTVLLNLILHGLANLAFSGRLFSTVGIGTKAVYELAKAAVDGWVTAYRTDLEADLADVQEPIAVFQHAIDAPYITAVVHHPRETSYAPPQSVEPIRESVEPISVIEQISEPVQVDTSANGAVALDAAAMLRRAIERRSNKSQ